MNARLLRWIITVGALTIMLTHILFPALKIDSIALILLVISIIPWVAPLFESLEFPGGWKLKFSDFKNAEDKAENLGLLIKEPKVNQKQYAFQLVANHDVNLALAGLRIEIEKRFIDIAQSHNIILPKAGLGQLLQILKSKQIISSETVSLIADLAGLLNSAVHGATVDPRAADWAVSVGPQLLNALDEKIKK